MDVTLYGLNGYSLNCPSFESYSLLHLSASLVKHPMFTFHPCPLFYFDGLCGNNPLMLVLTLKPSGIQEHPLRQSPFMMKNAKFNM